jgi:hypothetical protein
MGAIAYYNAAADDEAPRLGKQRVLPGAGVLVGNMVGDRPQFRMDAMG